MSKEGYSLNSLYFLGLCAHLRYQGVYSSSYFYWDSSFRCVRGFLGMNMTVLPWSGGERCEAVLEQTESWRMSINLEEKTGHLYQKCLTFHMFVESCYSIVVSLTFLKVSILLLNWYSVWLWTLRKGFDQVAHIVVHVSEAAPKRLSKNVHSGLYYPERNGFLGTPAR